MDPEEEEREMYVALKTFYLLKLKEIEHIVANNLNLVDDVILAKKPDYDYSTRVMKIAYAALCMRIHTLAMITLKDREPELARESVEMFNRIADDVERIFEETVVSRPDPNDPDSFKRLRLHI